MEFKTPPLKHQTRCLDEYGDRKFFALCGDMGTGKAIRNKGLVLTPVGWAQIGSMKVGDNVFAANGEITKVIGVYPQGRLQTYKVTMMDRGQVVCCEDHLFTVYSKNNMRRGQQGATKPLKELIGNLEYANGNRRQFIPVSAPLEFIPIDLPIHPYNLGVILGDGCIVNRSVSVSNSEQFIINRLLNNLPDCLTIKTKIKSCGDFKSTDNMIVNKIPYSGENKYVTMLDKMVLMGTVSNTKFIPNEYLFNSKINMIHILNGLMDTDAGVEDGAAIYCSSSEALANGVASICRSLGGIAWKSKKENCGYKDKHGDKVKCKDSWQIRLNLPKGINPFTLPRKANAYRPSSKYLPKFRAIVSIEKSETEECTCISIDHPSRLYITNDHIVTHNTWILLNNVLRLYRQDKCSDLIIFAPSGVYENWTRIEIPRHMHEDCNYKMLVWHGKDTKKFKKEVEEFKAHKGLRIMAMNWESLRTKRGFTFAESICIAADRLMIACDESDAVKNPDSATSRSLMKLKPYCAYRRILTGTVVDDSPFDVFAQYNFLDKSILKTTSFFAFKSRYAQMVPEDSPMMFAIKKNIPPSKNGYVATPQVVQRDAIGNPKYRNLSRLTKLIGPHTFRVLKSQCLDLPDKVYKAAFFELTKEQKAIYTKACEEFRLEYHGEDIPFHKLSKYTKLSQITSGYYVVPNTDVATRIDGDNPKMDYIKKCVKKITEAGNKIIIWASYRPQIEDLVSELSKICRVFEYHGGVSKEERLENIDNFQNGREPCCFIGNQQAGATGITLTAASYVIYFSNNFRLRLRLQSEDRAHRIGQYKSVTYLDMITKGTVDQYILDRLIGKKNIADRIMNSEEMLN